jgi:hypothetical protein
MSGFGYDLSLSDDEVIALCEAMTVYARICDEQVKQGVEGPCKGHLKSLVMVEKKFLANKRSLPPGLTLPGF